MKKLLTLISIALMSIGAMAQDFPTRGYRGFAGLGYGIGQRGDLETTFVIRSASTSHGYQIVPSVFIGVGVTPMMYYKGDRLSSINYGSTDFAMPFFLNMHFDLIQRKASPYIDVKVGDDIIGDFKETYISGSFGCRIKRFNIGLEYMLQTAQYGSNNMGVGLSASFDFGPRH